jgi:CBS domain containing-hemolysin-like protein
MFSLSKHEIELFRRSHNPRERRVAKLISRPGDLLVVLLMMNICVNILTQNAISEILPQNSFLHTVIFPLCLTLFIGEVFPKVIALNINRKVAKWVSFTNEKLTTFLAPIAKKAVHITNFISSFLFFFLKEQKELTEEELVHAMQKSKEKGVLDREEIELLTGFLELQRGQVKQIMTPREDILFYDIEKPLQELLYIFSKENYSKVPVCQQDLDHLLGVIDIQTYFQHLDKIEAGQSLEPLLKPAFFIPENSSIKSLIEEEELKEKQLAMIVDEYGVIEGLITDEDLTEVLVGDITDKRDEHKMLYTMPSKDIFITSAKLELYEFESLFNVTLPKEPNAVTIGGWLLERVGYLPKNGDEFRFNGLLFHVLQTAPNRILKLYIRKTKKQ